MDYLATFRLGRRSHSQVLDSVPNVPQAVTRELFRLNLAGKVKKGSEAAVASGSRAHRKLLIVYTAEGTDFRPHRDRGDHAETEDLP
jgi:hypothetical protein